jgi:hypothetical protein
MGYQQLREGKYIRSNQDIVSYFKEVLAGEMTYLEDWSCMTVLTSLIKKKEIIEKEEEVEEGRMKSGRLKKE